MGGYVAERCISKFDPDMLVGFSWGGGIVSWMIASRRWTGPALLLAPTLQKMRGIACIWPKLPSEDGSSEDAGVTLCHVIHANGDPFCPDSQVETFQRAGFKVHRYNDDHPLCGRETIEAITRSFQQLLETRRTGVS